MDNVKNDSYYLKKMIGDVTFIIANTAGITQDELQSNEVLRDSVMFRLIQISENSMRLSTEFRLANNSIPWQAIKGLRNRIVHEYGEVDLSVIYSTVTVDLPALCDQLKGLIEGC